MSEQLFGMMGMGTDQKTLRGLPQGTAPPPQQQEPIPTQLPTVEDDVNQLMERRNRLQGLSR